MSEGARVIRETVAETLARLNTFVGRMEHRYEMSSAEMVAGVRAGTVRETAEIAKWLMNVRFRDELRALPSSHPPSGPAPPGGAA